MSTTECVQALQPTQQTMLTKYQVQNANCRKLFNEINLTEQKLNKLKNNYNSSLAEMIQTKNILLKEGIKLWKNKCGVQLLMKTLIV